MVLTENDLFSTLGNNARECYFAFDIAQKKLVYIGPAIHTLTGIEANAVEQNIELLWEIVHPEDRDYVRKSLTALVKTQRIQAEFRIETGDRHKYLQLNGYLLKNGMAAGHVADITDLKNNIIYADKINARKNAMLAVLAHDLKEPVGVINMMASAIKRNPAVTDNEDILANIKVIQELCARNITLIKDLMNKEFLEAPEVGLRKERTDMSKTLGDLVKQYKDSEHVTGKHFEFIRSDMPVYAVVDMLKIAQCVNNLIANAIKFTPVGGSISVILSEQANSIEICVKDNGIGIPADLQPFLFDERTRAHRPGLHGEQGYGMGLSIIHLLVELHGGKVWVDSVEGAGSSFFIELPKGF